MKFAALALVVGVLVGVGCGGGIPTVAPDVATPIPSPVGAAVAVPAATVVPAAPAATMAAAVGPGLTPAPAAVVAPTVAPTAAETLPVPTATPASLIIAFPTPTPAPTTTPAPTVTPVPTPRPGGTALDPDICYRTPEVQEIILDKLNVLLCAMVSPRELFRIRDIGMAGILHPDDLAGFDNLLALYYEGALDFVDLSHTPNLRRLQLEGVREWPPGFNLDGLHRLEELEIGMRGEAACQIFRQGAIERIFGDLMGRWRI